MNTILIGKLDKPANTMIHTEGCTAIDSTGSCTAWAADGGTWIERVDSGSLRTPD